MRQAIPNLRNSSSPAAIAVFLLLAGGILAQEPAAESAAEEAKPVPLALEAITVEPAAPGPDTLCRLRVTIANRSAETVSALDFGVTVGGVSLPVYDRQLFLEPLPPGESTEVELFNFWTTETGRPAPKDGQLEVAVTLRGAQFLAITTEGEGEAETEVWTLGEPVPGLPIVNKKVLKLK